MTPALRLKGSPSPLEDETHDDAGLVAPIPFDAAVAGVPEHASTITAFDPFDVGPGAPDWLVAIARSIRPLCVGALMAIPTIGAATVGAVALFSDAAAQRMVRASVAFLNGVPTDITVLIGVLATGYGAAKTIERLKGK